MKFILLLWVKKVIDFLWNNTSIEKCDGIAEEINVTFFSEPIVIHHTI